jgi:hypothetical protein
MHRKASINCIITVFFGLMQSVSIGRNTKPHVLPRTILFYAAVTWSGCETNSPAVVSGLVIGWCTTCMSSGSHSVVYRQRITLHNDRLDPPSTLLSKGFWGALPPHANRLSRERQGSSALQRITMSHNTSLCTPCIRKVRSQRLYLSTVR